MEEVGRDMVFVGEGFKVNLAKKICFSFQVNLVFFFPNVSS